MKKIHFARKIGLCLLLFLGVGAFDYLTGYEVTSFPIYLLPILLAFFYFGKWGGYSASLVAIITWTVADISSGHQFSSDLFRVWNAGSRLLVYLLFVYGLSLYVKTVAVYRSRLESLRRTMPMCHNCGRIFCVDGKWHSPEEVLKMAGADLPECSECVDSTRSV